MIYVKAGFFKHLKKKAAQRKAVTLTLFSPGSQQEKCSQESMNLTRTFRCMHDSKQDCG